MIYSVFLLRHSWIVIDHHYCHHSLYGSWNGEIVLPYSDQTQRLTYSVIDVHHAYHALIWRYLVNSSHCVSYLIHSLVMTYVLYCWGRVTRSI